MYGQQKESTVNDRMCNEQKKQTMHPASNENKRKKKEKKNSVKKISVTNRQPRIIAERKKREPNPVGCRKKKPRRDRMQKSPVQNRSSRTICKGYMV